uniref:ABC transporter ATP-binding protein n=1 Tax=Strongyloides papillosus TaxID=174720 RepID=A0A0N5BUR7_STREA
MPDLDKVELADIPGIKKTCKPRLRNRVRNLKIKAKSFHMEGKLLCKISGTFIFPIKSAVTCINRDIMPDLDKVELADIPGIKKTCKPRLRNRVRSKTYKINSG